MELNTLCGLAAALVTVALLAAASAPADAEPGPPVPGDRSVVAPLDTFGLGNAALVGTAELLVTTPGPFVEEDRDEVADVYSVDLTTGTYRLVGPSGPAGEPFARRLEGASADGRRILFSSDAPELSGTQVTPFPTITYLHDRDTGGLVPLVPPGATPGAQYSGWSQISDDGSLVTFEWIEGQLDWHSFVLDLDDPTPMIEPLLPDGPRSTVVAVSDDGDRLIVLLASDGGDGSVAHLLDRVTGTTSPILGAGAGADIGLTFIDDEHVLRSREVEVGPPLDRWHDVSILDVTTGEEQLLLPADGEDLDDPTNPHLLDDGRHLVVDATLPGPDRVRAVVIVDLEDGSWQPVSKATQPESDPTMASVLDVAGDGTAIAYASRPDWTGAYGSWNGYFGSHAVWLAPSVADARCSSDPSVAPYVDVPLDHRFLTEIAWLRCRAITRLSTGTFGTTERLSRQAFAAFLVRDDDPMRELAGLTWPLPSFPDMPRPQNPLALEVQVAAARGWFTGYDDGTFRPAADVTRQAAAAALYRRAGSPDGDEPTCTTAPFSDVGTDHPFCGEIAWLASTGITTGWPDGTFRGGQPIERQAIAAMLHRFDQGPGAASP